MGDSDDDRRRRDYRGGSRDYRDSSSRKRPRDDERGSAGSNRRNDNAPVLQTFKQWIIGQNDDFIQPDDAATGYASYKVGERKKHVEQFFIDHKDEEWFKEKYHPEQSQTALKVHETFLRERFSAWKKLNDAGCTKNVTFDLENDGKLAKLLDAAIMLMESNTLEDCQTFLSDGAQKKVEEKKKEAVATENEDGEAKSESGDEEDGELMETKKPKPFKSLFIKNLSPEITKNDLIQVCKRYAGFVRVAFETIPHDTKFRRRAWVTFDDTVNIKDICWNLNNMRLRDNELGAVVDKVPELKDRIRNVPGLANHAPIAFRDLGLAVKCCEIRDKKLAELDAVQKAKAAEEAADESGDVPDDDEAQNLPVFWEGENDVLVAAKKFYDDYDDMYEERLKEILKAGESKSPKQAKLDGEDMPAVDGDGDEELVEIDLINDIFNVLDPLLVYLRVVHCIDFYNQGDYSVFEDEHPCRVGTCHVRGAIPNRGASNLTVKDFMLKFEEKTQASVLRALSAKLDDDKAKELGLKDVDEEVEKFVQDNSKMIEKDKFMCPLSGKKFKGPEYVRKHIFNKHGEKVDIVKRDCYYFNSYVVDAFKDGPPEPRYVAKSSMPARQDTDRSRSSRGGDDRRRDDRSARPDRREHSRGDYDRQRSSNGYNASGGGAHLSRHSKEQLSRAAGGREVIDYRDLDAPNDMDMFG